MEFTLDNLIEDSRSEQYKSYMIRGMYIIISLVHSMDRDIQNTILSHITHEALMANSTYRMIFRMCIRLREKQRREHIDQPIDFLSVYEEYKLRYEANKKDLPDMDDPETVLTFLCRTGTYPIFPGADYAALQCDTYVDYIIQVGLTRTSLLKAEMIPILGLDEANEIERKCLDLLASCKFKKQETMLDQVLSTLESIYNHDPGLSTGLIDLDRLTRLQRGCLYIIAGRPAMGKTAVALHLAQLKHGKKTLFISLEMPKDQLIKRLLSSVGGISHSLIGSGMQGATNKDLDQLAYASSKVGELNLMIFDDSSLSINALIDRCTKLKQTTNIASMQTALDVMKQSLGDISEDDLDRLDDDMKIQAKTYLRLQKQIKEATDNAIGLIIVDYLQLMNAKADGKKELIREQEIAAISRGLKQLAKLMDCPVVALAQINRGVESRPNKRPSLGDLRESGSIEQDADAVLMIYRDEVYNPNSTDKDIMEIGITKNRHGEVGVARVHFNKSMQKLSNI
jgi:replicative DNA helicase